MVKQPKYSVIIPVYNAERTLKRCVDSLLSQNYSDAEIILINDGSTDSSGTKCREYADANSGIVYIHKENGGVSSARNAGLEAASGKYILFVDSDDAVENGYFKQLDLLDSMDEYDVLWFSYKKTGNGKLSIHTLEPVIADTDSNCALLFSKALRFKSINPPWNKRYRNSIVQEHAVRFPERLSIGEDTVFNLRYALRCKNCKISNAVLYEVNIENEQSLSRRVRDDLSAQFQVLDREILSTIETADMSESDRARYFEAVNFTKLRSVYSEAKRMHLRGEAAAARRKRISGICDEINGKRATLPGDLLSRLLGIPVHLKMISIIDLLGRILAR